MTTQYNRITQLVILIHLQGNIPFGASSQVCVSPVVPHNQYCSIWIFTCTMCYYRYPDREVAGGGNASHNVVVYRTSDVVYDLEHTACSSDQYARLRLIQVCKKTSINSIFGSHLSTLE